MKKMILFILFLVAFFSCTTTRYIPVDSIRTDSIYINRVQHDSVYCHDSVYVRDKGDTVFFHTYKYIFVDKAIHDTLYVANTDSVLVPYPVEKDLSLWAKIKLEAGGFSLGGLFIILIYILIRLFKKTRC